MLRELSWDPNTPVPPQQAGAILRKLALEWDRALSGELLIPTAPLVWVRFELNQPLSPIRAVHGEARLDGNVLVWTITDDVAQIEKLLVVAGGLITIDVDCDVILDEKGRPVSSDLASARGVAAPRGGGICRSWIQVLKG